MRHDLDQGEDVPLPDLDDQLARSNAKAEEAVARLFGEARIAYCQRMRYRAALQEADAVLGQREADMPAAERAARAEEIVSAALEEQADD